MTALRADVDAALAFIEGAGFRLPLVFIAFLFDGAAQRGGRDTRRRHRPEGLVKNAVAQAQFPLRGECQQFLVLFHGEETEGAAGCHALRNRRRPWFFR